MPDRTTRRRLGAVVETFVRKLTGPELEAVLLAFVEGRGIRPTARHLGVTPAAIKGRLDGAYRKAGSDPTGVPALDAWIAQRRARDVQPEPAEPRLLPGEAGGDRSALRGLPAVGRGCTGAIRGSVPHRDAPSLR